MNCPVIRIAACVMACTSALAAKGESEMPMLSWAGKAKVANHHNDVPFRVLERKWVFGAGMAENPDCPENPEKPKATAVENMAIHGDNLAARRLGSGDSAIRRSNDKVHLASGRGSGSKP